MDDVGFEVGPWRVQPRLNTITGGGGYRRLEPKVMQVLVYLAARAGDVVSKEELIREAWPDTFVSDDALLRCISELRKALNDDPKEPRYIQTISKRGYRLIAEVSRPQTASAERRGTRADVRRRRLLAAGIALAAIIAGGYLALLRPWRPSGSSGERLMLAVLPFQNLSGDAGEEYFSEGLTDEMIAQLAGLQPARLGVIARTSSMQYKRAAKRISRIGRELGANYVVEGAVRREGTRVRITVRLVRVSDESHVWSESYDRELSGILSVQADVARAVAAGVRLTLGETSIAQLASARTVHSEAYVEYLMGRHHWHRLTPEDLETAARHFSRAVELDPGFARAWLGLSDSYRHLGSWWGDWPPRKAFPPAKEAMARALKLDSTLPEAHGSLGWIHFVYDWDWARAEAEFRRGVALGPNARDALSPYGNFLRRMKRLDEARVAIERAAEVDPLSPLEVTEAVRLYIDLGDTAKARQTAARLVETSPDSRPALWGIAQMHLATGKLDQALECMERAVRTTARDRLVLPALAEAYVKAGRLADARAVLQTLLTTPNVAQGAIAHVYTSLGEKEQAIRWWREAYDARDARMVWLRLSGPEHPLWSDPRFQQLIRRMKFPE